MFLYVCCCVISHGHEINLNLTFICLTGIVFCRDFGVYKLHILAFDYLSLSFIVPS